MTLGKTDLGRGMQGRLERLVGYLQMGGLRTVVPLLRSTVLSDHQTAIVHSPEVRFPFRIRVRTSDYFCFRQVFAQKQYALNVRWQPRTIVDAGANIGLASIYFCSVFPDARIIAIEPERGNLELLKRNCAPYPNIEAVFAALWDKDTRLHVSDIGNGAWGYVTWAKNEGDSPLPVSCEAVRAISMGSLLDGTGIDEVDILKVDIEGSEREVFAGRPDWLKKVGTLIIETHDWLRPGCQRVVDEATSDFEHRWRQGENLVVAREGACVAGPTGRPQSGPLH